MNGTLTSVKKYLERRTSTDPAMTPESRPRVKVEDNGVFRNKGSTVVEEILM